MQTASAPTAAAVDTVAVVSVVVPGHGRFAASAAAVDQTIAAHLPASPSQLRILVEERCGFLDNEYADVTDVTTLLVILAATSGIDQQLHGRTFD